MTKSSSFPSLRTLAIFFSLGAAALIVVFVTGWLAGSQVGTPIQEAIEYRHDSEPETRYAIRVRVDDSFYSFYRTFDAPAGAEGSTAALTGVTP